MSKFATLRGKINMSSVGKLVNETSAGEKFGTTPLSERLRLLAPGNLYTAGRNTFHRFTESRITGRVVGGVEEFIMRDICSATLLSQGKIGEATLLYIGATCFYGWFNSSIDQVSDYEYKPLLPQQ